MFHLRHTVHNLYFKIINLQLISKNLKLNYCCNFKIKTNPPNFNDTTSLAVTFLKSI